MKYDEEISLIIAENDSELPSRYGGQLQKKNSDETG
jgi:hypothetical protein